MTSSNHNLKKSDSFHITFCYSSRRAHCECCSMHLLKSVLFRTVQKVNRGPGECTLANIINWKIHSLEFCWTYFCWLTAKSSFCLKAAERSCLIKLKAFFTRKSRTGCKPQPASQAAVNIPVSFTHKANSERNTMLNQRKQKILQIWISAASKT